MEHEPDEPGDAEVEDDLDGRGDVDEHLATHLVHRMLGDRPQNAQSQRGQREEDAEDFEDPSGGRSPPVRLGLLSSLLGNGHGRRV
jgi:hypothetical protein